MINIGQGHDLDRLHVASGYCRERTWRGLPAITLWVEDFEKFVSQITPPRTMDDKIRLLLYYMKSKSESFGDPVELVLPDNYSLTYSKGIQEFYFVIKNMIDMKLLEKISDRVYKISYNGWNELDRLESKDKKTNNAFVAMSFSENMIDIYHAGIKPAIEECGYTPVRVDQEDYNEKIDDFIIAEIKKADFIVADYTQQKHGVYYEAGYAQGYGLPVIWCVNSAELDKCHFDIRQYNFIVWKEPKDLKEKLIARIQATIIE
jgi:nucleoside 2-deoxyribosyltransferase